MSEMVFTHAYHIHSRFFQVSLISKLYVSFCSSPNGSLRTTVFFIFSTLLFINIASVSGNGVELSPSPSVGLSVWKLYCGRTADWIQLPVITGIFQLM